MWCKGNVVILWSKSNNNVDMGGTAFRFKQFAVDMHGCGQKVGTDSVLLGAWADLGGARRVLDLGAGSGLLALMCAQRSDAAHITALEIDAAACAAARDNAQSSPWAQRITVVQGDALDYSPSAPLDLIITNPPYFSHGLESPKAARATARHGAGLTWEQAISLAAEWLSADGSLAMVTPADIAAEVVCHAEMRRLKVRRQCMVAPAEGRKPSLALWQLGRIDGPIAREQLAIRDSLQAYTKEYSALTSDFYLAF